MPLGYPTCPDRLRLEPIGDDADEDDARYEIVATGTVASGYLGDPALTAARFGTDADGTRWWRTGDLVQRAADGCLSHRGRIDDMVKIRGRLVEPAEPERVLRALPGRRERARSCPTPPTAEARAWSPISCSNPTRRSPRVGCVRPSPARSRPISCPVR